MIGSATRITAFSSCWILALLLLLGGCAWMVAGMFETSLPETPEIVTALRDLQQPAATEQAAFSLDALSREQLSLVYAALVPEKKVVRQHAEKPVEEVKAAQAAAPPQVQEVSLPQLAGVLVSERFGGSPYRVALLGKKHLQENQAIDGFQVASISVKGVVLVRGEKNWFIAVPPVSHTSTRVARPAAPVSKEPADESADEKTAMGTVQKNALSRVPPLPALRQSPSLRETSRS